MMNITDNQTNGFSLTKGHLLKWQKKALYVLNTAVKYLVSENMWGHMSALNEQDETLITGNFVYSEEF